MELDWSDLNLVLAICRSGTLSGAAKSLGINYTTVFRRINAIEKKLEVRLFDRQPTGYVMTEAGEVMKRSAERIDEEVVALSREILGKDLRLQGTIRITAPEGVALRLLAPHLAAFCTQHPDITMELIATSSPLRLSKREADLAVRVTSKPPDAYIGREVCKFRHGIYASPGYLENNQNLSLDEHLWVMSEDNFEYSPLPSWRKKFHPKSRVVFSSNNTIAVVDAAKRGLGVTLLPCILGDREPGLVRTRHIPEDLNFSLWILIHPDLRNTARVKALMTFLLSELENEKPAIEGTQN
jgi:molybdate transport repressor ModE-like protein